MGSTWCPSGADRTQVGPVLARELCYLGIDATKPSIYSFYSAKCLLKARKYTSMYYFNSQYWNCAVEIPASRRWYICMVNKMVVDGLVTQGACWDETVSSQEENSWRNLIERCKAHCGFYHADPPLKWFVWFPTALPHPNTMCLSDVSWFICMLPRLSKEISTQNWCHVN